MSICRVRYLFASTVVQATLVCVTSDETEWRDVYWYVSHLTVGEKSHQYDQHPVVRWYILRDGSWACIHICFPTAINFVDVVIPGEDKP